MQGYFVRPNWLHIEFHQVNWNQTDILELEPKTIYRNQKDATLCYVWTTPLASPL